MIRLVEATKTYAGAREPAVDRLSLEIFEGEIVMLVGPSGCGKTTTLKMINRIIEATAGRIEVHGRDVREIAAPELRRGIGYVIQQIGLFPHKTIGENIATVPRLLGWTRARIAERVDELIEVMGLTQEMVDRYPAELSGGQRQRVGVARALAVDPPILLMDEPFGAVDPIVRGRLQNELLGLQERLHKTIVFVTHDIDEALHLGDRVAILNVGAKLEQYATPEEILRRPASAFVERFLGAERGLRRLALRPISSLDLEPGPVVPATASVDEAKRVMDAHEVGWVGVLDGERLRGWVWQEELDPERPVGAAPTHDFRVWVPADASLRAALDAIVTSRNQVAVIYDGDHYVGMVTVEDLSRELLR